MNEGASSSTNVPKQEPGVSTDHVNIVVANQHGASIHFKIKRTTPLRKLMEAFCNRQSVTMSSVRFLFNGERLTEHMTPTDLGLSPDEEIQFDAVLMQTGGAK